VRCVHHPMFLYEFGDTAYVIREDDTIVAYLWGFVSSVGRIGYVHLVGVRASHRRKHLASQLYRHFIDEVRAKGCTEIKAITTPDNVTSIAFHRSLGMTLAGSPNENGIPVVWDYRGPGDDWVVFQMEL
jgi:L-amino acid N-acyltransferase YncA